MGLLAADICSVDIVRISTTHSIILLEKKLLQL